MDYSHQASPGKNTGVGYHVLLQGGLPNPGIEPRFPALQADSLPSEPLGKRERGSDPGKEVREGFPEEVTIALICK